MIAKVWLWFKSPASLNWRRLLVLLGFLLGAAILVSGFLVGFAELADYRDHNRMQAPRTAQDGLISDTPIGVRVQATASPTSVPVGTRALPPGPTETPLPPIPTFTMEQPTATLNPTLTRFEERARVALDTLSGDLSTFSRKHNWVLDDPTWLLDPTWVSNQETKVAVVRIDAEKLAGLEAPYVWDELNNTSAAILQDAMRLEEWYKLWLTSHHASDIEQATLCYTLLLADLDHARQVMQTPIPR